ncbi:MAG: accessory factor UbiK family protein [Fimbriimonadaceae bacterium]|nr:accessory factor UbiK family protein [Alphaproteobacteria bacterium]
MTQTTSRFFDEIARLMTDAAGVANGVRKEVDSVVRSQAERILNDLDVVSREEFDAVKEMAQKARLENDALAKRIAALEASTKAASGKSAPAKKAAPRKPAAKRTKPAPKAG